MPHLPRFASGMSKMAGARTVVLLLLAGTAVLAGLIGRDVWRAAGAYREVAADMAALRVEAGLERHPQESRLELLAGRARQQAAAAQRTLARCGMGILFFVVAAGAALPVMLHAHRVRQRTLADLQVSHSELAAAREMERRRAEVLEMLGRHAPLPDTLDAVAGLVSRANPRAGAGIWLLKDGRYELGASANVDPARLDPVRSVSRMDDLDVDANPPAMALHDGAGQAVGAIKLFFQPDAGPFPASLAGEIAQVAALVVENRRLFERLAFQAQHDSLTRLPNRILFHDRLQHTIRLARREQSRAAVIWMDMDRYKQVNDTYGHHAGDRLLLEVARRLEACVRDSDTVARVGGDEFGVVLGNVRAAADVEHVARKIMRAISAPYEIAGKQLSVSATCGISIFPDDGEDDSVLIRNADLAMYSAKRAGRNGCQAFVPQLADSLKRRLEIEAEMARALGDGGLRLAYQPMVDRLGAVAGLEALCRWQHPVLGAISPAEFIPIAEDCGLIWRLGEWVIREACREGMRWMAEGHEISRIAVNVSPRQLAQPGFSDVVARALADSGYPAQRLEIEVTESVFMTSREAARAQIEMLRQLGVRFAIDDFGTGYSSLSRLAELPIDVVKIDRSFINGLANNDTGYRTLVRGIIALAHGLRLHVVAEGVETDAQLEILQSMDCDLAQGFLLHPPMAPGEVPAALAGHSMAGGSIS